jgi:twinkle protein
MDATEIKLALAANVQSVAEYLFPNGKRVGNEWEVGSLQGEPGHSLKIHIGGAKNAVWKDFSSGEGRQDGNDGMVDLWMGAKGISSFPEALDDIREYLGVEKPSFESPAITYKRPERPACRSPENNVREYLYGRGIGEKTIKAYGIGEDGKNIVFPFLRDGELIMYKVREAVDGAKPIPGQKGMEPCLFGWQVVPDDARAIVITEGEIDALSIYESTGLPALSVPFGGGSGGKQKWIDGEYHNLDRFERIYLCLDQDEPGREGEDTILSRLGAHRCFRVRLPHKDANDALREGCDIQRYIEEATLKTPDELVPVENFMEDVIELATNGEHLDGYLLPWPFTYDKVSIKSGELSIWAGKTNSGKSQITSHMMVDHIKQGAKICIASLEMSPKRYLYRCARQIIGTDDLTTEGIKNAFRYMYDHIWCYNLIGKADVPTMLDSFLYAKKRFGCDTFIVDNLMMLGVRNDDYAAQAEVVHQLTRFAVENDVHVHLVCHTRKSSEGHASDSIRGAGELADTAFNIFIISRDRNLEDMRAAAETEEQLTELSSKHGVWLKIDKQRNGDWQGDIGLEFDKSSYRYLTSKDEMVYSMVNHNG